MTEVVQGNALPVWTLSAGYRFPPKFNNRDIFKNLLLEILKIGVSDVFIQPGYPVCILKSKRLYAVTPSTLDAAEVQMILGFLVNRGNAMADIAGGKAINARYDLIDPLLRDARGAHITYGFRVNASPILHFGTNSMQIVMRSIPNEVPHYKSLGITDDLISRVTPAHGIVYVAGATGSGKSTTFAGILRYILENETPIQGNIIIFEEPIEYVFKNIRSKHSMVAQSEIPTHFPNFMAANREAMRRAPGLMVIGELRDQETVKAAIEASMTGHPVFATVHANNVAAVTRRLITRIPLEERDTVTHDIIDATECVIAQSLIRGVDDNLIAIREYLTFNKEVRAELDVKASELGEITQKVAHLVEKFGLSFRKAALELLEEGKITEETALHVAKSNGYKGLEA